MSSGFHLHTSDSIEQLAAQYIACREEKPEEFHSNDLFSVEEVIVPSWGMGKWLERCLADQGIMLANVKFISLFSFFTRLLAGQSDNEQEAKFDRDTLAWRIYGILQEHPNEFTEFNRYIENGDDNESKKLRLFCLSKSRSVATSTFAAG